MSTLIVQKTMAYPRLTVVQYRGNFPAGTLPPPLLCNCYNRSPPLQDFTRTAAYHKLNSVRRESALHSVGLSTLVGLLGTAVYRWTRATRCLTRIVLYTKADANRTMCRSNFKTTAAAMLNFQGFKILTSSRGQRASLRHLVKFHRNRSSGCGDIAFNRFSKWPTSAILDFKF